MTTTLRTIATIVLVTAVLLGALAATGYTFRGRLADTPIVGAVIDRLGWRAEEDVDPAAADAGMGDMGMATSMASMPDPMPAMSEPAAVGLPVRRSISIRGGSSSSACGRRPSSVGS